VAGSVLDLQRMRTTTLAHVSDLHLGLSPRGEWAAVRICRTLLEARVDHVVVTGDLTHKGRRRELALFRLAFAPLIEAGRLTLVPGNHDRATENAAEEIMPGPRVQAEERDGLYLVRLDSTAPHNRSLLTSHGQVGEEDIQAVDRALREAPRGALTALALHHHLLPLPGDVFHENLVSWLGWPWCDEVAAGERLLERLRGRCDLVLHGHRHVPAERLLGGPRPLAIYNAGSSPDLGRIRIFRHRGGALAAEPQWLPFAAGAPRPAPRPSASGVAAA
jgi:3',5'-cyclic-AMP phosphodiesterase